MSRAPFVVALNTFRESVRDRVLYNLIFFALLMIAAAVVVGKISIGIEHEVIINLGLTAISFFGLAMAIFIGVGLVYKEIEKRTLYSLLAKPVRRWEFLAGKYLGLLLTLTINTALMAAGVFAALLYVNHKFVRSDAHILIAVYFILLELALATVIALFFSCFSTPMLSTVFTLGFFIAGTFASDIRGVGELTGSVGVKAAATGIYYLLPNFANLNVIAAVAHGDAIPRSLIALNTAYTLVYSAAVLLAASAIFSSRNLK
ncbi:MAG TPA: ABC transporter permease [Candidatus Acidoferrales bacterium]|nr:ABC transporter permease [Candidatus Acidoferrales bacterium]